MSPANLLFAATALLPPLFMLAAMSPGRVAAVWRRFHVLSVVALVLTVGGLALQLAGAPGASGPMPPGLGVTLVGAWVAVLVQLLGTVIGVFSSRYLQGEPGQMRYVAALGAEKFYRREYKPFNQVQPLYLRPSYAEEAAR